MKGVASTFTSSKKGIGVGAIILTLILAIPFVFAAGYNRGQDDIHEIIAFNQFFGDVIRRSLYIGLTTDLNNLTEDSAQLIIAYDVWGKGVDKITITATKGLFSLNGGAPNKTVSIDPERRYIDVITYYFPRQGSLLDNDQVIVEFYRRDSVMFTERVDFAWLRAEQTPETAQPSKRP